MTQIAVAKKGTRNSESLCSTKLKIPSEFSISITFKDYDKEKRNVHNLDKKKKFPS